MEDAQLQDTNMDSSWMDFSYDSSKSKTNEETREHAVSTSMKASGLISGVLGVSGKNNCIYNHSILMHNSIVKVVIVAAV